jgi:hypothetical protein
MKKPYLDNFQRFAIKHNTSLGAVLRVNLEFKKLVREFGKVYINPILRPFE